MPRRTRPRTESGVGILLARSALILIRNITYSEKRTRRGFVLPRSTQEHQGWCRKARSLSTRDFNRYSPWLSRSASNGSRFKAPSGAMMSLVCCASLRGSVPGVLGKDVSRFLSRRPLREPHRQIAALVFRLPCAQSVALERVRPGASPKYRRRSDHPARTPGALHLDAGHSPRSPTPQVAQEVVGREHLPLVHARPSRRSYSTRLSSNCSRSGALLVCMSRAWRPATSPSSAAV